MKKKAVKKAPKKAVKKKYVSPLTPKEIKELAAAGRENAIRVWHVPQVPGAMFYVSVSSISEARLVIKTLGRYDAFQFDENIKPDYCSASGLEERDNGNGTWFEWNDEDGNEIRDSEVQ